MGERREDVDPLIRVCVECGLKKSALSAAKLGGRDLFPEEVDFLVEFYIQDGKMSEAIETAAKLGASKKKICYLAELCAALEAVNLGASKEEINSLIKLCLQNGLINSASMLAKVVGGRDLSIEEVRLLIKAVIENYF